MTTLDRYVEAQSGHHCVAYAEALEELRVGRKVSHWIWYVLPQLRALGRSAMAREYGLADKAEAAAYLAHPVLGPRLIACVTAMLGHGHLSAEAILGPVDAMKFQSCLTLFAAAATRVEDRAVLAQALDVFYAGRRDDLTLQLLADQASAG
jgi:uncharacterized protein (DUF1810 family)